MKDGYLDDAEIFDDIKEFKWKKTDMVVGGFPCQPFSNAGDRKGEADDRNMWPDTLRVIRMARPRYVFLENVPGLLSGDDEGRQPYVYTVLRDLAEEGFDAEWEIVGADDAGASHRRKRWFCFAYRKLADSCEQGLEGIRFSRQEEHSSGCGDVSEGFNAELADSTTKRLQEGEFTGVESSPEEESKRGNQFAKESVYSYFGIPDYPPGPSDSSGWEYLLSIMPEIEPAFCRILDDGKMANRMDRLKALGNAVAWQAGAIALRLCIERSGVLDGAAES
jgi:site-specific DNA-cytosine methylase